MNIRCAFCQTPYTLGRTEKLIALQHMETEKLSHYDAHCPRCRKATPVLREKMKPPSPTGTMHCMNWKPKWKRRPPQLRSRRLLLLLRPNPSLHTNTAPIQKPSLRQ